MSREIAINVQSLSKTFKLFASRRDRVKEFFHPMRKCYHQDFHALQDVSLTVEKGEVLGIIGQNGSGKSTLLKILSSVVTPTSGSFTCDGRLTALLELGGGFNNDLTGVENIYYLGAIQGYKKKEMSARIKDILEFADIGEYAYQPVSRYSSGMYVRLAFSMSINIDPDILITDEALAVGDLRFQQKCYRKIKDFKDAGKTIVICTHSMSVVKDFCNRAIWLHEGKIREQGDPLYVTDCYNAFMNSQQTVRAHVVNPGMLDPSTLELDHRQIPAEYHDAEWSALKNCESYGSGQAKIHYAALLDAASNLNIHQLKGGEKVKVLLYVEAQQKIMNPDIHLVLNGPFGSSVFKISNTVYEQQLSLNEDKPSLLSIQFTFPAIGNGRYTLSAGLLSHENGSSHFHHWVHDALIMEVYNPDLKFHQGTQMVIEKAVFERINN